ncbi:polyphosphate kinase 2 family protein [Psychrobacter sp. I-STPA10]|uniref:polyphosphate kinase 2 family protein n=1 Tax=Psychrobacter sp. I-STPA10 TaxID=2585769 RepID=UPI001E417726|nr:polyphosphate kinase 2 family protein [Psychrobacter sp. I-STPA10]
MSKDNNYQNYQVKQGKKLKLSDIDPSDTGGYSEKKALEKTADYCKKLAKWQSKLYAEKKQSLLIVLQALDAGGKDGTVNHVINALNPQGAKVTGFKQPTAEELAHDFLWRIHPHTPAHGEIAVFNRSHYEDVLVTRVHKIIDMPTCKARYQRIKEFETLLTDNNTKVVKFFLHISKDEQLNRFAERLDNPAKNWKISDSDYSERLLWDDYTQAFEDALSATSTKDAPWYVIPANNKWYRNLVVSQILADTLKAMHPQYPQPSVDLDKIRQEYHQAKVTEDKK